MANINGAISYIIWKLAQNGWNETVFNIPETNSTIVVTPCAQAYPEIQGINQVEFFLVDPSDDINVPGFDTVKQLAEFLCNYKNVLLEKRKAQDNCRKWYKLHILALLKKGENPSEDDWSYYSDYHKDCFGFRPAREYA